MKKIIIAFDGTHFSEGAFEFAHKLNELRPILLAGIFLPQTDIANVWSYAPADDDSMPLIESEEAAVVEQNIERFKKLCKRHAIECMVHKYPFDFLFPELGRESRYADVLILGSELFYQDMGRGITGDYLKSALHNVKCPVIIVPEKFAFPKNIILAYDGTDDSIYAIKQFAYLFPELTSLQTLLVYANDNGGSVPEKLLIKELAGRHFRNLTIMTLDLNPKKYFASWVEAKQSPILVSGSYGRSGFSLLFRRSFVKEIIADHTLPVFIAHK